MGASVPSQAAPTGQRNGRVALRMCCLLKQPGSKTNARKRCRQLSCKTHIQLHAFETNFVQVAAELQERTQHDAGQYQLSHETHFHLDVVKASALHNAAVLQKRTQHNAGQC
jgi:hypothetical protein